MSLHLITAKIIHPICSFLFGVIFFGATAVGILTGQVLSVCEDMPSPNNIASLLHINTIPQLHVWKELVYSKCVNIPNLLVTTVYNDEGGAVCLDISMNLSNMRMPTS